MSASSGGMLTSLVSRPLGARCVFFFSGMPADGSGMISMLLSSEELCGDSAMGSIVITSGRRSSLELDGLPSLPGDAPWRLGLSAVIEETTGRKSFWALAHPPGKADFHHPDCFAFELPAA